VVLRVVHLVVHGVADACGCHSGRWPRIVKAVPVWVVFTVEPPLPAVVDGEQAGSAQEECSGTAGYSGDGTGCEVVVVVGPGLGVPGENMRPGRSHVDNTAGSPSHF
jgi:hypothetical protein